MIPRSRLAESTAQLAETGSSIIVDGWRVTLLPSDPQMGRLHVVMPDVLVDPPNRGVGLLVDAAGAVVWLDRPADLGAWLERSARRIDPRSLAQALVCSLPAADHLARPQRVWDETQAEHLSEADALRLGLQPPHWRGDDLRFWSVYGVRFPGGRGTGVNEWTVSDQPRARWRIIPVAAHLRDPFYA